MAAAFFLPACTTTGTGISMPKFPTIGKNEQPEPEPIIQVPLPMPTVEFTEVQYIPTVIIPATTFLDTQIDVSLVDKFINEITPAARHYPPNFPSNTQKYNSREALKHYTAWIQPYAEDPNASYDVLMRAARLNGMARNMDMGTEYTVNGSNYVARALEQNPESVEANLLYGIMLAEGGAFKTSRKYLDKAAEMGSIEAEQTIAQSELLNDKLSEALARLQQLQLNNPHNPLITHQISIVEDGKYYIWDIPAPHINIKPMD